VDRCDDGYRPRVIGGNVQLRHSSAPTYKKFESKMQKQMLSNDKRKENRKFASSSGNHIDKPLLLLAARSSPHYFWPVRVKLCQVLLTSTRTD
jgi:hypothetical protein